MSNPVFFDIETGPSPLCRLLEIMPDFKGVKPVQSEFDPASVKTGNLKDPTKIEAKIKAAEAKHVDDFETKLAEYESAKEQHKQDFIRNAALSATTGEVLAIGLYTPHNDNVSILSETEEIPEAQVLFTFWKLAVRMRTEGRRMIGLNIFDFDLPFLVRRSWILGVDTPTWLLSQNRYWNDIFIDLRSNWLCGQWPKGMKSSFDELARAFGTAGKTEGVTGADFATLWEDDRDLAIEYLTNDLKQPYEWAKRMGVCV